jgi:hypothetical protein
MSSLLNFFPCRVSRGVRSRTSGLILILTLALAFLLFPSPSSASTVIGLPGNYLTLSSGLVGYWPLDGKTTNWATGKTNDVSGNANTGQLINMSTTTSPVPGKIGQALKFNGTSSYISQSNSLAKGQTNLTVSAWVKPAAAADYSVIYFEPTAGGVGQSRVALFLMAARTIEFGGRVAAQEPTGAFTGQLTTGTVSLNKWTHVVGVWNTNANTISIYFNGVLQSTTAVGAGTPGAFATTNPNASFPQRIGYDGGDAVFNGLIDDVRIYNRALSPTEGQALYKIGAANVTHSNTTALSSGLVGYWTFDGGTTHWNTGKVDDVSGQGNTGQLINMSTSTSPVPGKIGGALKFNGSTSYVSEGTSISNIQSVAFWAKATTGVSQGLINLTGSSVYISTNASRVISGTGFTSPTYYVDGIASTTPGLYDANWHRIVVTGTAAITGSQIEIGRANSVYFGGTLDDVRIYNRALSAWEVSQLYAMGRATLLAIHATYTATDNPAFQNEGFAAGSFTFPAVNFGTPSFDRTAVVYVASDYIISCCSVTIGGKTATQVPNTNVWVAALPPGTYNGDPSGRTASVVITAGSTDDIGLLAGEVTSSHLLPSVANYTNPYTDYADPQVMTSATMVPHNGVGVVFARTGGYVAETPIWDSSTTPDLWNQTSLGNHVESMGGHTNASGSWTPSASGSNLTYGFGFQGFRFTVLAWGP